MGNHRFKLSDMMPNAWFYKLRDMSKPKTRNPKKNRSAPPTQTPSRKSYYHSTESRLTRSPSMSPNNLKSADARFPSRDPHQRSSSSAKKHANRKTIYMPSPKHAAPDSPSGDSIFQEDSSEDDPDPSSSYRCKTTDIIIDVDRVSYGSVSLSRFTEFDMISDQDLNLPPIVTRPTKNKVSPKKTAGPGPRKSVSRAGGVKVRIRGNQGTREHRRRRRSCEKTAGLFYSESLAIVKSSVDPEKDFRESMMEMIVENNIRESKDLEDLLACYLSLNSNQYHGLIIKAFEQIWFTVSARRS